MKKILIFLLGCAVGYACWQAFVITDSRETEKTPVVEDTVSMTISVKNELKEVENDSVVSIDSLTVESVIAE